MKEMRMVSEKKLVLMIVYKLMDRKELMEVRFEGKHKKLQLIRNLKTE
jgi:hypothetical protein